MKASDIISAFRIGFKGRFLTAFSVIVVTLLYALLSDPFYKIILIIAFAVSAELFLFISFRYVIGNGLSLLFGSNETDWQKTPPDWLSEMSEKVGVEIKKFGVMKNLDNAYATFDGKVVFGEKLCQRLGRNSLKGIAAHELLHIKNSHHFKKGICLGFFVVSIAFSFYMLGLPVIMSWIAVLAYMMVFLPVISWKYEFDADISAARAIGGGRVKNSLLNFADENKLDEYSETHPSIKRRVEELERFQVENDMRCRYG